MINTAQSNEHALWAQILRRENEAKRRFEYLTGETAAKQFYNGQNVTNVENKLTTFEKQRQTQQPSRSGMQASKTIQSKRSSRSNLDSVTKNRYHSSAKADALSRALGDVLSEKRSQAKRGSSSVSRSNLATQQPYSNTINNVRTFRDVDSQANRYRKTINEMSNLGLAGRNVTLSPGKPYPVPVREGVFDRNIKADGIKYADAKTKARKFDIDKLSQAYNPNRFTHVSAATALVDPYVTIRHEQALPIKDPAYKPLVQQETQVRDRTRRVITDYQGVPMIKVDQEGGIFDQQLKQGSYKTFSPLQGVSHAQKGKGNLYGQGASQRGGSREQLASKFLDVQTALQTVGKAGVGARDITDIDSTLSSRGLMQRKLYLMKMMLKNEKTANKMIKGRIGEMDKELHSNNYTMRQLEQNVSTRRT